MIQQQYNLKTKVETKIRSAESKPDITNLATKSSLTAVENKTPDVNGFVKKADYSTEISSIKNDYNTNAALASQLNDLKCQHIADEVKKVDDKAKKNVGDILGFESGLKQKEELIYELERAVQSFYGDQFYNHSWLIFKADYHSFDFINSRYITYQRSKGIFNGTLGSVANSSNNKPDIHLS